MAIIKDAQQNQTVNSQAPAATANQAPDPKEYKAPEMKPVTTEVDANNETVEQRLSNLTSGSSRYVNQAKKDAMRNANSRGLINSTIAAGAGTDAAIRNALPIAQQDAKTYSDNRVNNQAAQNDFLKNTQSANLNKERDSHLSSLRAGEMEADAGYKAQQSVLQSQLSQVEQEQLNELSMKRDQAQAELSIDEKRLLADLESKRDASLSQLKRQEMAQESQQNIERDTARSALTQEEANNQNRLNIERDVKNTELNKSIAEFESSLKQSEMNLDYDLKTAMENIINDAKFSDSVKLQYVQSADSIIRQTGIDITNIGLSDRSAAQQASAIKLAQENRDATLKMYSDLMGSFNDWSWSRDFTPATVVKPDPTIVKVPDHVA